jgi:uncharacterized protein YjbI with pentapeptide repeats
MIDFENLDLANLDFKQLAEEFKNFGKMLSSAEQVLAKAKAGESLAGAKLWGLDLAGADLHGVNLERASLMKTNLAGANLENARLAEAVIKNAISPPQNFQVPIWPASA